MPCFLNPLKDRSCLRLVCRGDTTLPEIATVWRQAQESLAKTGRNKVLMDVTTLQTTPDMEEVFDLAKLFWRDFPSSGKIALVVRWEQSRFAKLLEMLVRTVGVYLTVFVSEEQAEAWISDGALDGKIVEEFAQ